MRWNWPTPILQMWSLPRRLYGQRFSLPWHWRGDNLKLSPVVNALFIWFSLSLIIVWLDWAVRPTSALHKSFARIPMRGMSVGLQWISLSGSLHDNSSWSHIPAPTLRRHRRVPRGNCSMRFQLELCQHRRVLWMHMFKRFRKKLHSRMCSSAGNVPGRNDLW